MEQDHFGLTTRPFQLTPDPRFWFDTATHRKAMAYLGYGLAQGEGFIVITGEIGAGKTTLAGHLVETIDPQRLNVVRLVSTAIGADDLLRTVATALGVEPAGLTKAELLTAIERGLHAVARTGRRTLLMVDEVQALPVDSLEELRMLSNFQAGGHALLQILLLGQPEFRERLHGSDRLEQLRQRVIAIHHLDPMGEDEVADYLAHRLGVAGWQGRPDFAADAFPAFHRGSGGIPRRLNQLAARTMLAAAIEGHELIDARLVRAVLRDLHDDLPRAHVAPVVRAIAPVAVPDAAPVSEVVATVPETVVADADAEAVVAVPAPVAAVFEPVATQPVSVVETMAMPVVAEPESVADETPHPVVQRDAEAVPVVQRDAEAVVPDAPEAPPVVTYDDSVLVARVAELEARVEQQDVALRRVLTLLVDWADAELPRNSNSNSAFAPIRGPGAWDAAA